jgi:hypothetical protein
MIESMIRNGIFAVSKYLCARDRLISKRKQANSW